MSPILICFEIVHLYCMHQSLNRLGFLFEIDRNKTAVFSGLANLKNLYRKLHAIK
jgi:hypothetical protein